MARPTILLVEDEPDVRSSIADFLHACVGGVEVVAVASAEEALEVLSRRPVSLVVSDFLLPGMDGLRLLARARALAPGAPRLLVTAFTGAEVGAEELDAAGLQAVLLKPLDADQLLVQVRRGLGIPGTARASGSHPPVPPSPPPRHRRSPRAMSAHATGAPGAHAAAHAVAHAAGRAAGRIVRDA